LNRACDLVVGDGYTSISVSGPGDDATNAFQDCVAIRKPCVIGAALGLRHPDPATISTYIPTICGVRIFKKIIAFELKTDKDEARLSSKGTSAKC
jgi:hypothetical protein